MYLWTWGCIDDCPHLPRRGYKTRQSARRAQREHEKRSGHKVDGLWQAYFPKCCPICGQDIPR